MGALVITEEVLSEIKEVIAYANEHVYSIDDLKKIVESELPIPGKIEEHCIKIPVNFNCVFSFEMQKMGKCRHLSVSISEKSRYPAPQAMNLLMKEFGFTGDIENIGEGAVFMEKEAEAVNVIQKVQNDI